MPFAIVRNDITKMQVDAIVNTANPKPIIGSGVDAGIHQAAGPQLLAARKEIGRIGVGDAAVTPGFDLNARYVIHTVGPAWRGGFLGEARLLRSCYVSSLALAWEKGCTSIAFPLISTGNYSFPKDKALQIASKAIGEFLERHEMQVYLVVFDRDSFRLSETLFREVSSFIDENYIHEKHTQQKLPDDRLHRRRIPQAREADWFDAPETEGEDGFAAPAAVEKNWFDTPVTDEDDWFHDVSYGAAPSPKKAASDDSAPRPPKAARPSAKAIFSGASLPSSKAKPSLSELLAQTDAGFSETLLRLIDQTGKKDSEIYTKANLSRQHFSKIRNNPHYQPTKPTAIALALALELDLEQTRDLIGRAGYTLTSSSKFDVIIMYFIREKNYNLFDINAALFEFDQSLLGA